MKNRFLLIGGLATVALLGGGWALAQTSGYGGFGPGGMQGMGPGMHGRMGQGMHDQMGSGMHGRMGPDMRGRMGSGMHGGSDMMQFDPAQIDTLKSELGITTAQEPAWTKYTKAFQDSAATRKATRDGVDRDAVSKMTPQDRFAFGTSIREQAQKLFETVRTAADELLATLDEAQKTKAQGILPGLAFEPGMRGAMSGPHHQH